MILSNGFASLDVDVLDSSTLARRVDTVLHFRILGQPPDATIREHTGLSGDLDFSVPDVATAWDIVEMHSSGALSLDNTLRRNLIRDPRGTAASRWTPDAGTGGVVTETLVAGATDGPTLPDGTTSSTYVRYTWTTANSAGTPSVGPANDGSVQGAYAQGTPVATALYVRPSIPIAAPRDAVTVRLPNGNIVTSSVPRPALAANTWTLVGLADVLGAIAGGVASYITPRLNLSDQIMPIGSTVDVTCALIERADAVGPFFDGNTLSGAGFDYWTTPSGSVQTVGPPYDLSYVALSVDVPHYDPETQRWVVRARGVQEVNA